VRESGRDEELAALREQQKVEAAVHAAKVSKQQETLEGRGRVQGSGV
jgi:hypothetical protein